VRKRSSAGQVALALNLVIAIFVVGSLGLVTYEMSRVLLAREQLQHCLELCALGGGTAMASSSLTGQAARDNATQAALNILQMNSILGQSLLNSISQVPSLAQLAPTPGQVDVYMEFMDPVTKQPAAAGQDANVLRVYGAYSYPLFSGGFGANGVGVYTFWVEATAGLPALDLMIVYNHSSSTDDLTKVTLVRRYWDPNVPAISYLIPNPGLPEQGPIYGITCPNPIGSGLNALPPQNLDAAGDGNTSNCIKEFSEVGNTGNTVPLRGLSNAGSPPGDAPPSAGGVGLSGLVAGPGNKISDYACVPRKFPALRWLCQFDHLLEQPAQAWYSTGFDPGSNSYNPWGANPTMFTDLVVNLDGNNQFGGYTGTGVFSGYSFPTIDFVVEASRGNMENSNLTPSVHTDYLINNVTQPGWLNAYQCLAYQQLQPKRTVEGAVQTFMTKMLQTSDCHFGFVAYNNRAGQSPTDMDSAPMVSWAYPVAGNQYYLMPQIPLSTNTNNYTQINSLLSNPTSNIPALFTPNGGSNLASGLAQALENLNSSNSRTGALKAIVVVTNTVPTRDNAGNAYPDPGNNGPALTQALAEATSCNTAGIPIFVVALDQDGQMTPYFQSQFSDTTAGGLVNTAGNGGVLYIDQWVDPTTTSASLIGDLNNVVRQLMSLVQG
jgi:hypothetical protein